ncbi:MAG: hypothetical protein KAZ87_08535 [Spirochaetes bacterium]|nr:hypothetical protein [Spirochaetota bacterium]
MKKLLFTFLFLAVSLLLACISSPEKKYSEGITNTTLTVFSKIDLYLITEDEEDSIYEKKLLEQINKRAIFLMAAYGEKQLINSRDIAEYGLLLNESNFKPDILYKNEIDGYLYVWAEYNILPFVEILNNASK